MTRTLRLAFTADLHWGIRRTGDVATRAMLDFLKARPPDVLVLAGDVGAGRDFAACLELFRDLPCRKALVPGNHDIWVEAGDERGDSLQVYQRYLPDVCTQHGFHYLDRGPLILAEHGLALCGSINWYDYSWSLEELRRKVPDWEWRLREKRFTQGRHNDARYVRWPLDDVRFTAQVVQTLEQHLRQALGQIGQAILVAHHPPFYGLSFPRLAPPQDLDGLLWDALAGNRAMEELLKAYDGRIRYAFCGHTHRERENRLGEIRGYNIGGSYHFKRLLLLDWLDGAVEAHTFGEPWYPGQHRRG